jgi:transposase
MRSCVFVGLDWAYRSHAVCVIDAQGSVLKHLTISHDRQGLSELQHALAAFGKALPVAIERPSGLIVDALVEAGHQVFAIHPNAVKASRPRYRSTNAKSDAGDAFMLADLLRTDGHRWHALQPQSAAIRALRALVRTRDDLVATRIRLANQLTALLDAYWPGAT